MYVYVVSHKGDNRVQQVFATMKAAEAFVVELETVKAFKPGTWEVVSYRVHTN